MVRIGDEGRWFARKSMWEESIAVVKSRNLCNGKKAMPGRKATVRNLVKKEKIFQLREHPVPHMANFGIKNDDIGGENSYFLNDSYYISR